MSQVPGGSFQARVDAFFDRIGRHLPYTGQRESFATYAFGILGDAERKSVEPIAARACPDPKGARRMHDRLLHFVRESPWSDRAVRREAASYVIDALSAQEPVTTWVIDDTGMLKQGKHSPGVQRQYTGSAGKITNCQLGVSLSVATRSEQVPIDFELYLPESWTSDVARRRAARVPDDVVFKTKIDLAIDMIRRAIDNKIPGDVVLADCFYGRASSFRNTIYGYGLDFAVATDPATLVWTLDSREHRRGDAETALQLGLSLGAGAFRRVTWRDGTKGKMSSNFLFRRVKVAHDDGIDPAQRPPLWLVIEWLDGEEKPTKFALTTLHRRMSKKEIVRTIKERWKTERVYQELKTELGFDHFEGRSFVGWHHHVSVVLSCYALVVAERVGAFPPSSARSYRARPVRVAA
jgi:SRSO17 transposase